MPPYNSNTTAEEVAADCQSHILNKTILVTGVSPGGLGAAFATIISQYKPTCLILATRSLSKAQATAKEIALVAPHVRTWPIELDLSSQAQIRKATKEINGLGEKIDIIVDNAGIMAPPFEKTVDGIESQFGSNHIGHFLLTNLLLPKILERGVSVRVVSVSSGGFRLGPVRFEDWNFDDGKVYSHWVAYGQSKTANMLFALSLAQKLGKKGLVATSLHPGVINTGLARNLQMEAFDELRELDCKLGYKALWDQPFQYKTPSQGVATHVFAAFHPSLDSPELNGSYLSDSEVVDPKAIQSWGRDHIEAERLWELSEKLVGEKFAY